MLRLKAEGHEEIRTPAHEDASFVLRYGELAIGTLTLHEGQWEFEYSDAFRSQSEVQPLVDFPDSLKRYYSGTLWPFFMARIPSVAQPGVRTTIAEEGLDEHSDVQLLRRFGKQTISNPFVLLAS